MSTLADAMLAWKAKLTTKMTSEQVLTLRSDVNDFADDVRFLEDENEQLKTANAELRELSKFFHYKCCDTRKECNELKDKIDELVDENAKLCDLIRYMWYADYAGHFSTLPNHQEHKMTVWQRMRELGIIE